MNTLSIYEDGNFFLSAGDEKNAYLHSTRTGQVLKIYDFKLNGYDNIKILKSQS